MAKSKVTLSRLIAAINKLGFAVTLTPLESIQTTPTVRNVPPTGLEARLEASGDLPAVDAAAPHGRDANGAPLAPFGLKKDGTPKKTRAGRPRVSTPAATPPKAPAASQKTPRPTGPANNPGTFSLDLSDIGLGGPTAPPPTVEPPTPVAEPSTDDVLNDLEASLADL